MPTETDHNILIALLNKAADLASQFSGGYSGEFMDAEEFHSALADSIKKLKGGDSAQLEKLNSWFLPTSCWDDFVVIAGQPLANEISKLLIKMTDLQKAKKLFFNYDGSTFYMSRNGVEGEYQSYHIPDLLQNEWLNELRAEKLTVLNEPGNWKVVYFLNTHRQEGYLDQLISVKPLGKFWEKCAYLETLLNYAINTQKPNQSQLPKLITFIADRINEMERTIKAAHSKQRIGGIKEQLEQLKDGLKNK
ncbi:MAG: hypothetical protein ABIP95_12735 [Pelobium sp.]